MLAPGRPPRRRRQHRLDAARGDARRARRARRRRLHRAAVPHLRGVPRRAPAHAIIRSCSMRTSTASTCCSAPRADLAMDVVNLKISKLGGLTKTRQAARPLRLDGDRDDARGQLGRRHHDGGHRASRAQHARRVSLHEHRFQQLRHGQHRRGRAAARERLHGGQRRSRARHPAAADVLGARVMDIF